MVGRANIEIQGLTEEHVVDEIKSNLETLYSTPEGSIPGDRNYGLNQDFLGVPANVAENLFSLELYEKTQIYEPRVEIQDIRYEHQDGKMIPYIKVGWQEAEEAEQEE